MYIGIMLNIDDKLLDQASRLSGVREKAALVRLEWKALVSRESSKQPAKPGKTENGSPANYSLSTGDITIIVLVDTSSGLTIYEKVVSISGNYFREQK